MKKVIKKGCGCLLVTALLVVFFTIIAMFVFKPKWHDEYGQRFQDISYGNRQHNTYDLYLPKDATSNDSLALILYIHGGSWLGGDKDEHHSDCYTWVQKGYATATMNYSLLNEKEVSLPTMLDEIKQCIRHISSFAANKGVHIRQMAIAGTSAGGYLAMSFAYNHDHPIPLRFEAIKVGPADFSILFPHDANAKVEDVEKFVFCCTGKHLDTRNYTKEWLDSIKMQASPVAHISSITALPAIFAYGEKDSLIKPAHYRALTERYDSLSKPYTLIIFPNSGHLLMNDKNQIERYDSTLSNYCKTYFGY